MGLGHFGGGVGVTRWLAAQGATVLVTDLSPPDKLKPAIEQIRPLIDQGQVSLRLGEHNVSDFTTCDLVVANPAVPKPWDNRFLRAASAAGIPITTEIRLAVERLPNRARTIAITGSNGKSTSSAMIAHILRHAGQEVVFGGNIGGSFINDVAGSQAPIGPNTWVVLELSSFMLHWLAAEQTPARTPSAGWSPHIAVITNIAPNHLDWHGSLEHYEASKQQLVRDQRPGDIAVVHATPESGPARWTLPPGVQRIALAPDAAVSGLAIPGSHNRDNAAMAVAACVATRNVSRDVAERIVRTFKGLPHRLELIGEFRGVRFFNDSKSTTPDATLLAARAFAQDPGLRHVHLIVGGYDKGSDLAPLGRLAIDTNLAGLYAIGTTGPAIAAASNGRAIESQTLAAAMRAIASRMKPGDIVLLSPGCASWDQFENYEHRGSTFATLAQEIHG
jgi:UDP-N-acetylmuramoylalanine--D-glutamate ligase